MSDKAIITLADAFKKNERRLQNMLPQGANLRQLMSTIMYVVDKNPKLCQTTPESLFAAAVTCIKAGLDPADPARGLVYIIPYAGVATVQMGYQGYLELARRSGQVKSIHAQEVRKGEDFEFRVDLNGPHFSHVLSWSESEITHVYAVAILTHGGSIVEVLTRAQIERARASSMSARKSGGPWDTHWLEMAKKTAIRRLAKRLPLAYDASISKIIHQDDILSRGENPPAMTIDGEVTDDPGKIIFTAPTQEPESEQVLGDAAAATQKTAAERIMSKIQSGVAVTGARTTSALESPPPWGPQPSVVVDSQPTTKTAAAAFAPGDDVLVTGQDGGKTERYSLIVDDGDALIMEGRDGAPVRIMKGMIKNIVKA